ncbi:MAG: hypothetical protein R2909_14915 [Gemmatimonadales bacterium]
MTMRKTPWLAALALGALALMAARHVDTDERGLRLGAAPVQSLGALTFGPDGTLFGADTRAGLLYAFDPAESGEATGFGDRTMVPDLDRKIASLLGTTRDRIRFGDMAVHPKSHAIYLSVSRIDGADAAPALVRVSGSDRVELVDFGKIKFASTELPAAPAKDAKTPWGQPQWSMAVTQLRYSDGELWVAGLSNEQFASALRRVPFPFGKGGSVNTVEIYHTSHDRWETASPIEAFLPITIGGVPMVIAGYGCSPIAVFERSKLEGSRHLKGRTVAELGGGNRPIDIVGYEKDGKRWLLIANSNRTMMRMDPEKVAKAPGLTTPVSEAYEPSGVGYLAIASSGVLQIADFDSALVAVLQRDLQSGAVQVFGFKKAWL